MDELQVWARSSLPEVAHQRPVPLAFDIEQRRNRGARCTPFGLVPSSLPRFLSLEPFAPRIHATGAYIYPCVRFADRNAIPSANRRVRMGKKALACGLLCGGARQPHAR